MNGKYFNDDLIGRCIKRIAWMDRDGWLLAINLDIRCTSMNTNFNSHFVHSISSPTKQYSDFLYLVTSLT
jgi:hypothetical protein